MRWLLALALVGCAVPQAGEVETQGNTCSSDDDCGTSGACTNVGHAKICAAKEVSLTGLEFVVTAPGGVSTVAAGPAAFGTQGRLDLAKTTKGGFAEEFNLRLPAAQVVSFVTTYPCDGQHPVEVPATIVLTGTSGGLGGSANVITGPADPNSPIRQIATITPGLYQGWVKPAASAGCSDTPPPTLVDLCFLDAKDCPAETTQIAPRTRLNLPESYVLKGSLTTLFSLDQWTLDIIDAEGARQVSDVQTLEQPSGVATQLAFNDLHFSWPSRDLDLLIRLTPPAGSSAPTIYWDLATTLGPSSKYEVKLTTGKFLSHKVKTEVLVSDHATKSRPSRNLPDVGVTFVATSIEDLDCLYTFSATAVTNQDGLATADLPPGRYEALATPLSDASLTLANKTVIVHDTHEASGGHGIQLWKRPKLESRLETATGDPLGGIQVLAVPTGGASPFVYHANTLPTLPGQTSSATTREDGSFVLPLDVNAYLNVSAQPPSTSGYPWVVIPQVLLTSPASKLSDGALKASWPAVVEGLVTDSNGSPIANAVIGAYLPVAGEKATTTVQIGTATSDANGEYVLFLPSSIASLE